MKNLCCFFNAPSLYREAIYKKIDQLYECDWYFGDYDEKVKLFDTRVLKNVNFLHVGNAGKRIYWTYGLLPLLFNKKYKSYFFYGATWDLNLWLFLFLKALFFRKKKLNLWVHGWYGKENFFEGFLKKVMYNIADSVFCYGDYARNLLIKLGYSEDKVCAIHNSLDYDTQKELRIKMHLTRIYKEHFNNSNPTIIFIGRLTEIKRLDILIDALAGLKNKGQYYNLVFIGDGPLKEVLREKVMALQLIEQVWFYGACYDEKTNAELIYNADLCVAPGNIGLTAIHCMMFGTPCVTHNDFAFQMPEFEAIKPNVTGAFFVRDNVDDLTNKIETWIINHRNKRDCVRKNCYKEIDDNWNPYYQIDILEKNLYIF